MCYASVLIGYGWKLTEASCAADEGGGEDMAAEADEGAAEPEDGAEMEGGPEQGGGRPDDADEEEAGKEERDDTEGPGACATITRCICEV